MMSFRKEDSAKDLGKEFALQLCNYGKESSRMLNKVHDKDSLEDSNLLSFLETPQYDHLDNATLFKLNSFAGIRVY